MEKTLDDRASNIRTIMAVSALRRVDCRTFLRIALNEMDAEQLAVVLQKIGEWMSENPPPKDKS